MAQQLELFGHAPPVQSLLVKLSDRGYGYAQEFLELVEGIPFVIRKRILNGSLIASKYSHLSLYEAALVFIGDNVKPAQANAWILALLMAQVRPPQREAIGSSPKRSLKRRSGHQAREPPHANAFCYFPTEFEINCPAAREFAQGKHFGAPPGT